MIIVDTGFWLALANRNDLYHTQAITVLANVNEPLITTWAVVTEQLKGSLDYYLYADQKLLVVEAKNADLARGFTQLAVELVAIDAWTDSQERNLQGAVSTGDIWQFGLLNRESKQITQDINLYRVLADIEDLLRIFVAILGC